MSSSKLIADSNQSSTFAQLWGTTWRKALVSIPRLVPDAALRFTSKDGPQPIVIKLPSRSKHLIPVYIFVPPVITTDPDTQRNQQPVPLPTLLDFHGGGFVLGSCQEQAPFCAKLCRELNCIVITVDYRLGPYAQFPAANEDAEDVLHAILTPSKPGYQELRKAINLSILKLAEPNSTPPKISLDTARIAISGFSSGGNLALNLALNVSPTPPLLTFPWPSPIPHNHTSPIPLLLFYPSLDARQLPHERPLPPGLDPPKGFLASLNLEAELMPTYLPRDKATHPRASPGLVSLSEPDTLHESARMLLVLPGFDTLAEQSGIWIEKVRKEGRGNALEVLNIPGMLHGWTQFPDGWLDKRARKAKGMVFEKAVAFVKACWEGASGPDDEMKG